MSKHVVFVESFILIASSWYLSVIHLFTAMIESLRAIMRAERLIKYSENLQKLVAWFGLSKTYLNPYEIFIIDCFEAALLPWFSLCFVTRFNI